MKIKQNVLGILIIIVIFGTIIISSALGLWETNNSFRSGGGHHGGRISQSQYIESGTENS